jgi:hypothetical protein
MNLTLNGLIFSILYLKCNSLFSIPLESQIQGMTKKNNNASSFETSPNRHCRGNQAIIVI